LRYKFRYSAHPIHFERFRRLWDFDGIAEMRSVFPIYARLRNTRRIISPPWRGNADVSVIHI
jgi:hypothetical protein